MDLFMLPTEICRLVLWSVVCAGILGCDVKPQSIAQQPASTPITTTNLTPIRFARNEGRSRETSVLRTTRFENAAQSLGVSFTYDNGTTPKQLMVESTGAGCGWLDYDRDGWIDLYFCQGGAPDAADPSSRPMDELYRNFEGLEFVSVSRSLGVAEHEYGQGVAAGDFNNDGFADLYVTNVGQNHCYVNQGDGTFRDATEVAGMTWIGWSSSSAWGDLDRDGDLDLYVCRYGEYDPYRPLPCLTKKGVHGICHPMHIDHTPDECYENLGDGSFRPVAQEWGLFGLGNQALGVVIADLTEDGWPDVYVANDTTPNFLFVNQRDGTFKDAAMIMGCAVSMTGAPQASMGVGFGDYDQNGHLDLCLTHFTGEWNTLYSNLGLQGFHDVSPITGLRELTMPKLGFGTVMHDFNSDRRMELFFANGHVDPLNSDGDGYEMSPQLLFFDGQRWTDQSAEAGNYFAGKYVGRGVAAGDFDRDGDTDLAVVHQNSPAAILRNDSDSGHWLRLAFSCSRSNRDGVGTRVIVRQGLKSLVGELAGGTSYASAHELALHFGLGDNREACQLEVRWPSGAVQTIPNVAVDQRRLLIEPAHAE